MSQLSSAQPQGNIFNSHLLGSTSFSPSTPIESALLQKSLLELYTKSIPSKKPNRLPTARMTLTPHGIIVAVTKGKDEYFPLKDIFSCSALTFTGCKVKSNNKKSYTYFFDNIKPTQQQSIDQNLLQPPVQWTLFKTQKYLLKMKHPPLIAILIRRQNKPIEIHVFVCESAEKALSLSYSVDMAQRIEKEQPSPVHEIYQSSSLNPFKQESFQPEYISQKNNSVSMAEPELPEVIRKLERLGGGKGTVINPVVKTANVNLINDNKFYVDPGFNYNGSCGDLSNVNKADVYNAGRKSVRNESSSEYMKVQQARKSASIQQLNNLSLLPETSFEKPIQDKESNYYNMKEKKRTAQPPNQLSIHIKNKPSDSSGQIYSQLQRRKSQNVSDLLENKGKHSKAANRSTTFISRDTDIMLIAMSDDFTKGDSKSKPVAKVQPHKVTGVKVFPDGNDRTFLMPDRERLRKVAYSEKNELDVENKITPSNNQINRSSPNNGNLRRIIPTNYYNNYNNKSTNAITPPQSFRSSPLTVNNQRNKNYLEINLNPNDRRSNPNITTESKHNDKGSETDRDGNKEIWWNGGFVKMI